MPPMSGAAEPRARVCEYVASHRRLSDGMSHFHYKNAIPMFLGVLLIKSTACTGKWRGKA